MIVHTHNPSYEAVGSLEVTNLTLTFTTKRLLLNGVVLSNNLKQGDVISFIHFKTVKTFF